MKYNSEPTFNDLLIELSNVSLIGNPRENAKLVSKEEVENIFYSAKETIKQRDKSELFKISYCLKNVIIAISRKGFVWEINISNIPT